MKEIAKRAAYRCGILPAIHRFSHGATLTATMFHRVLADDDPRWRDADPLYTVGATFFARCLAFFRRHYNVVSLRQVVEAATSGAALPPRAMLVTFDDGWADNLETAAPIMRRLDVPGVVFVAASAVMANEDEWWQERLFGAARDGVFAGGAPARLAAAVPDIPSHDGRVDPLALAARLAALDGEVRARAMADLPRREAGRRMMLRPAELPALVAAGVSLGVHGHSHAPLTLLPDPAGDLSRARAELAALGGGLGDWSTLAIPHGRYDARVLDGAWAAGFKLVFTSDAHINATPGCFAGGRTRLGRISVDQPILVDGAGALDEAKLAAWLWRRPVR
ncbi:MAG: polysaccharide deacetylase family protein [Alphaproteobacteria bacterium]|nr:polysaccharide deacetylase family protein [Alphaproteobacteria bacterium]